MPRILTKLLRNEDGITAVEYSVIALVILVGIVASVSILGTVVSKAFNTVGSSISTAAS